ncbi:Rhs element Vgr protein [Roseateles aquatilis]|uniref:Rhs element Vgr protein n=2 Tax=Roseateles aquatilis TaxID=431061 RepID=A0A246IZI5_9BURK|nr:Rhs element Vgr protein [Roseateles aquatilis]
MARLLFKDSLDYTQVKVHNGEYLPFGWQPDDTAMTPNGEMYFNKKHFKEDFSVTSESTRHWFIHEMVHVWQHQLGYPVRLRGAIRIGLGYDYELKAGTTLGDYNMESQGDLLADYFVLKHLNAPQAMNQQQFANQLTLFEEVLNVFLKNPADTANLP